MKTAVPQIGPTARPLRKIPVYELLAGDLRHHGIETVFGLMSDDTAALASTLDSIGIAFHGARHENNAIAMAEGYAAASGRLGVAVVGRGPATANGLHAAVYASRTGSPVLIIYGDAALGSDMTNAPGPDYKSFNAQGVLGAAGLQTFRATSAAAARTVLADAVAAARSGKAAALLLPTDVQLAEIEARPDDVPPLAGSVERALGVARSQAIEAATAVLRDKRRPLILAGLGAHRADAREAIEVLADKVGALLITTARAKDMFRHHPYNLGIIGSFSHSNARRWTNQADCVIAFGASLNFLTTSFGHFVPPVPLIQVDAIRSNIGRWGDADVALVGDAKSVAEQLLQALPARSDTDKPFHCDETRSSIAEFDAGQDFRTAHTARTVDPRALAMELDKLLPENRSLVYDAGNFLGVAPYLAVSGPDHFKFTTDFASIGLGFGTALGYARARPDSTTVLVIGDGGFLMTMGELETVVREDLPLVIVVMNDCAYGAELHFLRLRQLPVGKSVFPDVDFAPIAQGFAFEAATIRSLDDLRTAAPLLREPQGPILLDCKINQAIASPFMSEFAAFEEGEN
ncbi:MAG: thiamine pyrophosphate-binding protein [Gammaproteobacteria bacterium]